jgi:hypothetical protein
MKLAEWEGRKIPKLCGAEVGEYSQQLTVKKNPKTRNGYKIHLPQAHG